MIRVILQGRIGNNLFQYAAGRTLAIQHNTNLVLDGAWSNTAHARQFEHLTRLPIQATYERHFSVIKRALLKTTRINPSSLHRGPIYHELSPTYDPHFHQAADNSLLIGFFQSPQYFARIESQLRRELDLSLVEIPDQSLHFEDDLRSNLTTSIHVRRGDYMRIDATHCLGNDYHERAINWYRQRYEGIRFCLFSDDIPWCRKHFKGDEFLFSDFSEASEDPLHDLRLMAACQHHIIVNSSYSWWGAWLNPSINKQVVGPRMWMKNLSSKETLPKEWIQL